jgi:signal transduction histidine kinase/HAMP domain-containing protein
MSALFVVGLLGAGYLNRQVIIRPINKLVGATRAVASGDFTAKVEIDREDELGTLGASFNTMVEQLRESERVLEQRVDERTRELNALLDVSQRISSELSLDDLVDTIIRIASELFDTTGATVTAVDEAGGATLMGTNSPALAELGVKRGFTYSMDDFGILWDELRAGRGIVVDDVSGDSAFAAAYREATRPEAPELHRQGRSWMAVPMMTQGRVTGWLAVTHREPGRYSDAHLSVARAMASQAAVALENARLYETAQQRARELSTLLEVSLNAAASIELGPLVNLVLRELDGVIPHDRVAIQTYEKGYLTVLAARDASPAGEKAEGRDGYRVRVADDFFATRFPDRIPAIIDDILDEGDLAKEFRAIAHPHINSGLVPRGSYMAIPLMSRDHIVGLLTLMRDQPGFYTVDHASLGRAIGSQIAIAVDRARSFEREARRARELSTLLDVSRGVASNIELDPLLESVLDQLVSIVDYDRAVVWVHEGNALVIRAARDLGGAGGYVTSTRIGDRLDTSEEPLPSWFTGDEPVIIDDVRGETPEAREYRAHLRPDRVSDPPHGSYMGIPLFVQDHVVGMLALARDEAGYYTLEHARLGRAIGSQIAVAIDNARLFEETRRSARETEALLRADRELFGTLNLDEVLQALVDVAVDVLAADKSVVVLHQGDIDVVRAARNHSPDNLALFSQTLATMPHEEPPPEGQTPQVYIDAPAEAPEFVREALARESIASHISVPVKDATRMLGVFGVSFVTEHAFTDDEQRLYVALADRAAVAIQNAELYERAQHAASLEERQRLARELHDSVSQALYGIALGARTARLRINENPATAAEPIDYVATLAEAGLAEMRALIFELRPESLATEGLVAAIEKQIASTRARHQLSIDAELMDEPDCQLEVKEALYRITQEALQNVVKHALATHVSVELARNGVGLRLTVSDDGRGFDPSREFPGHIGLHSMPERAAKLGGSVVVESVPGRGTRVTAEIPV